MRGFIFKWRNRLRLAHWALLPALALAAALLGGAGCAGSKKAGGQTPPAVTVRLQPLVNLAEDGDGFARNFLDHPVAVTAPALKAQLASLRYRELSFFGRQRALFTGSEADLLSVRLARALQRATQKQTAGFTLDVAAGITEGEVFYKAPQLHWRLTRIRGKKFADTMARSGQFPRGQGTFWRLEPQRGQQYYTAQRFPANLTYENWILADLDSPPRMVSKARLKPPP